MITQDQQDQLIDHGVNVFLNAVRLARADQGANNHTAVKAMKTQLKQSINDGLEFMKTLPS